MLKKIKEKIPAQYIQVLTWVIKDIFKRYRFKLIQVFLLIALTIVIPLFGAKFATNYVQHLGSNELVTIGSYSFLPRESVILLALNSLCIFVILVVAAFTIYVTRNIIAKIMVDYYEHSEKRVLISATKPMPLKVLLNLEISEPVELRIFLMRCSRFFARVLNELLSLAVSVIAGIIIVPILLYINFWLTVMIILMVALSMFSYIRLGRHVASIAVLLIERAVENSGYKTGIMNQIIYTSPQNEEAIEKIYSDKRSSQFFKTFRKRIMVPHMGMLIGGLQAAFSVTILIVVFGAQIIVSQQSWPQMIFYMLTLIFLLMNIPRFAKSVTQINSFYPFIREMVRFFDLTEKMEKHSKKYQQGIDTNVKELVTKPKLVNLKKGQPTIISVPKINMTKFEAGDVLRAIMPKDDFGKISDADLLKLEVVTASIPYIPVTFWEILHLPEQKRVDVPYEKLKNQILEVYPFKETIDECFREISRINLSNFNASIWLKFPMKYKFILLLMAKIHNNPHVIFLPLEGLNTLAEEEQDYILSLLEDKISIFYTTQPLSESRLYNSKNYINYTSMAPKKVVNAVYFEDDEDMILPDKTKVSR